jgi:hypothetical protein
MGAENEKYWPAAMPCMPRARGLISAVTQIHLPIDFTVAQLLHGTRGKYMFRGRTYRLKQV